MVYYIICTQKHFHIYNSPQRLALGRYLTHILEFPRRYAFSG